MKYRNPAETCAARRNKFHGASGTDKHPQDDKKEKKEVGGTQKLIIGRNLVGTDEKERRGTRGSEKPGAYLVLLCLSTCSTNPRTRHSFLARESVQLVTNQAQVQPYEPNAIKPVIEVISSLC